MSDAVLNVLRPQPTGGLVVTFKQDVDSNIQNNILTNSVGAGIQSLSTSGLDQFDKMATDIPAVNFHDVGIAVVTETEDANQINETLSANDAIEMVRPEFWMFDVAAYDDTSDRTWGIAATGAETSPYTGKDIKICVLDTGLDEGHQDFTARNITSRSFVSGETSHDVQGHGTHCAGVASGQNRLANILRYGVAPDAELFVGKVLNNSGSGRERDIIAGMLWAINQGCEVISMSLGRSVRQGETFSPEYERIGQLALTQNTLIVAAAGNDSSRHIGYVAPVGAPANSPSIMAIAALDQNLDVAYFSCGGINGNGGEVDVAAPGVAIFSSVPRPRNYKSLQGTSMACPHVAGLAALWAESDPSLRGSALWRKIRDTATNINLPASDVGAGLSQAPTAKIS